MCWAQSFKELPHGKQYKCIEHNSAVLYSSTAEYKATGTGFSKCKEDIG